MGFNVRFHHMPPAQESPTSPFRLDLVITFQKLFLGRWTGCCCASNRMKLAKWASIYHGNLRALDKALFGRHWGRTFEFSWSLQSEGLPFMLKRTPFPSNSAAIRDFLKAADAEFDQDRVSLNSKGWVGKVTFGPRIRGSSWVTYGIARETP